MFCSDGTGWPLRMAGAYSHCFTQAIAASAKNSDLVTYLGLPTFPSAPIVTITVTTPLLMERLLAFWGYLGSTYLISCAGINSSSIILGESFRVVDRDGAVVEA